MSDITREDLHAYLADSLGEAETARVEQALRDSEALRKQLRQAMQERECGEHSLGGIWQRERITCPSRERLNSFLLGACDEAELDYIAFHLQTVECRFCLANLADLEALQKEPTPKAKERRRRFFQGSAGFLQIARDKGAKG
jgi:hypothetical protein